MSAIIDNLKDAGPVAAAVARRRDLTAWMASRPIILATMSLHETGLLLNTSVDGSLKQLAELKVATLVECEFCIDLGAALADRRAVAPQKVIDLPRFRESDAYTDLERLVLELADRMTRTPAEGLDPLREELLAHLTRAQFVELVEVIAWENKRARMNKALGVGSAGLSEDAVCALPAPRGSTAAEPPAE